MISQAKIQGAVNNTWNNFRDLLQQFGESKNDDLVRLTHAFGTKQATGNQYRLVNNLIADGLVEKSDKNGNIFIKPTSKGWKLFGDLPSQQELHERFGRDRTPRIDTTQKHKDCVVCGNRVDADRRRDCKKCWSCETVSERILANKDHLPRTQAYYNKIGMGRAKTERARLSALRRDDVASYMKREPSVAATKPTEFLTKPNKTGVPMLPAIAPLDPVYQLIEELSNKISELERQVQLLQERGNPIKVKTNVDPMQMAVLIADLREAGYKINR